MWVWPDWGYENGIEDIDDVFVWLQLARHSTEHPQGKVFVLLSSEENETYTIAEKMRKEQIIYESDSYVMYGYSSYNELQKDLNQGG